jgi:hypothetical protein
MRVARSPVKYINLLFSGHIRSDYPPITNIEQRRKYKTEFDKDYAEYRTLHAVMEKARNRFANLQSKLRDVDPSDERKYKVKTEKFILYQFNINFLVHCHVN